MYSADYEQVYDSSSHNYGYRVFFGKGNRNQQFSCGKRRGKPRDCAQCNGKIERGGHYRYQSGEKRDHSGEEP